MVNALKRFFRFRRIKQRILSKLRYEYLTEPSISVEEAVRNILSDLEITLAGADRNHPKNILEEAIYTLGLDKNGKQQLKYYLIEHYIFI